MNKKEFIFDVEYIRDTKYTLIGKRQIIPVSVHEIRRGITLKQLVEVIELYKTLDQEREEDRITLNIRGVNF